MRLSYTHTTRVCAILATWIAAATTVCEAAAAAAGPVHVLRAEHPPTRIGFHDTVTSHYVSLHGHSVPQSHDLHLRRRSSSNSSTGLVNVHDVYYIIDLVIGNQTIPVTVDTGSSDTWVVKQPYQCISMRWEPGKVCSSLSLSLSLKNKF